jgi:hypothetical protein
MEIIETIPAFKKYWSDDHISHHFKYGVVVRYAHMTKAIDAFVTIYCGFDSTVWTYRKTHTVGDLNIVYVHDLDWQVIAKLHGIDFIPMVTSILVNPRFNDV